MSAFSVFAPLSFFEKSSAEPGKQRRIAGVISTETTDKQDEVILQKGLDFAPFVREGWFNDNHSKATDGVLGYPDGPTKIFSRGDRLPDGTIAKSNCTWAEGYLLDTPKAQGIWELGRALAKSGSSRRLGFSIEGAVLQRQGPRNNVVAKAVVRNVAITNCPVGQDTRMEILAKSLGAVEKGLTMGTATPGTAPTGPATGAGAGQILARESLEAKKARKAAGVPDPDDEDEEMDLKKAVDFIQSELGVDRLTAIDVLEVLMITAP